jgi:hypothetical protein
MRVEHKHHFTPLEKLALGLKLADARAKLRELRGQKKTLMGQLNGDIAGSEILQDDLAEKMRLGYEVQQVDAVLSFDTPRRGRAQLALIDSGEIIEERAMTDKELQGEFAFRPPAEGPTQ